MVQIQHFFDTLSKTFSYVVSDTQTGECAIIDSVLDFDMASGSTDTASADAIIDYVSKQGLRVAWLIETHVHADHLSAASYIKSKLGGRIAISAGIKQVQASFAEVYDLDIKRINSEQSFDHLFYDDERFFIGSLPARAIATTGHTPACMSYVVADKHVFVGDTLFMPDYGTARCDFPNGSAHALYDSIQRLYALGDDVVVYLCHDYLSAERQSYCHTTTIGEQRRANIHVRDGVDKASFVALRNARDATLAMPQLLLPAIQVNMRAGQLPEPANNGTRYLKLPLNKFKK